MGTKTPAKPKAEKAAPATGESKFVRGVTKADGTPWGDRRSNEELLKEWKEKLPKAQARHKKEIDNIESKIRYFTDLVAGKDEAAKELLADGMTPEQIEAWEAKLRRAKEALKGKTPEEIEAMRQVAQAEKAAKGVQAGASVETLAAEAPADDEGPVPVNPAPAAPAVPEFLAPKA